MTTMPTTIEIEVPAALYQPFVRAVVARFEQVQPTREWTDAELSDVLLQGGMRPARDKLAAVSAVLDQLAWTTIPRTIVITADSELIRETVNGAVQNTLQDFSLISEDGAWPGIDLARYYLLAEQLVALTDLLRDAHDASNGTTAGES